MFLKLYVFLLLRFGVSIVLVINGHGTRLDDILVSGLARQAALHRIAISAKRRGSPRCAPGHMAEVERQERSGILTAQGANIFNGHTNVRSTLANQDYTMRIWDTNKPNASLKVIYRIGSYKEKKRKEVDTSRMGY
jgi:hypothetical protein